MSLTRSILMIVIYNSFCGSCLSGEFNSDEISFEDRVVNGLRTLKSNLSYTDSLGYVWKTNAGDRTNGASIPIALQPLIGDAFDSSFVRAAAIHDRYCDKENRHRVRSWRRTHRVFYEMLLDSGVSAAKARIMYYAVYNFGPKWGYLDAPIMCGPNCVQSAGDRYYEQNEYNFQEATIEEWQALLRALETNEDMSVAEVETLGTRWRPNDGNFSLRGTEADPNAD